jgi:hypothetical protein
MTRLSRLLLMLSCTVLLFSCKKKEEVPVPVPEGGTYFSIRDFTKDQWKTYHGQPILITKLITKDNKTDSATLSALTMRWSEIFKIFFETDISDPRFLNQYEFELFEEETTQTRTFSYTAKDPALFTQKLQLAADVFTNKIRNIYIETQEQDFWKTTTQKLFYSPMRVIQIQKHTDPLIGWQKEVVTQYKFM